MVLQCSSFAQVNWIKDASNPVLRRDTIIWNLPNDLIAISDPYVLYVSGEYRMWYTAGGLNYPIDTELRSRICYASSLDGINWSKYAGNPVLDVDYAGAWDSLGVETVSVLIDSLAPATERFKMWYAGQYFNSYRYDIGYAVSPDGINWQKHAQPVLQVGGSNEWDNGFLEGPSVILENGIYRMWYCGYDASVDGSPTDGQANIGYAESSDGINWVKHAQNPVLTVDAGAWDQIYVQDPHVLKLNGQYHMWYGGNEVDGYGQQVGYATSSDGINWTKSLSNPVLTRGGPGEWDRQTASFPSVLLQNGMYRMWYTGKDIEPVANDLNYYWEVGYAEAPSNSLIENELNVRVYPNPVKAELHIDLPFMSTAVFQLFDPSARLIWEFSLNDWNDGILNLSELPAGCYSWVLIHGAQRTRGKIIHY